MRWIPFSEQPPFMERPCRQFIRIEGSRYHSGAHWGRVWCGDAFIRKDDDPEALLGYRKADILRLCVDGDMEPETAQVTHWMPAAFPLLMDVEPAPSKAEIMAIHDRTIEMLKG